MSINLVKENNIEYVPFVFCLSYRIKTYKNSLGIESREFLYVLNISIECSKLP